MPRLRILLVNTKIPRSTKKMVAGVRELLTKVTNKIKCDPYMVLSPQYPNIIAPVLESIEAISHRAELLLDSLAALSSSTASTSVETTTEAATIHTSLQV